MPDRVRGTFEDIVSPMMFRSFSDQLHVYGRQRLGRSTQLYEAAVEKVELWPAQLVEGAPAKVLDGQYERAVKGGFSRSKDVEIETLRGGPKMAGPTCMYRFRNITIARTWLTSRGRLEYFGYPGNELVLGRPRHFKTATLASSFQGCRFFGHWLRDDCATALLPSEFDTRLAMTMPDWSDIPVYRRLFEQRDAETVTHAVIDELIYFDDIYQNAHKVKRFETLRETLRKHLTPKAEGRIVYIARGPSAKNRVFLNEPAVIEELSRHGIEILFAESADSEDFIRTLLDARLIISVEGSQLSHALYTLPRNGGLICIQPPDRMFTSHYDWARVMGIDFGVVVGEQGEGGFTLPAEDILRTIDLF